MIGSDVAARMTYTGAPEAMQAAVAAGLCGLSSSRDGPAPRLGEHTARVLGAG